LGGPLAHAPAMGLGVCAPGPHQRIGRGGKENWIVEQELADRVLPLNEAGKGTVSLKPSPGRNICAFWIGSH
jgi:hypothetical protein